MNGYKPSELIRQLRMEKGLTQEQLAEGICSPVTISRIENGTQQPSNRVLELLLDRLGDGLFHTMDTTVLQTDVREIKSREEEILHYIAAGNIAEAVSLLSEVSDAALSLPAQQQRKKYIEALLHHQEEGNKNMPEMQRLLEEALLLTKPKFDRMDFRSTILTSQEMQIINFLSIVLWEQAEYRQNRQERKPESRVCFPVPGGTDEKEGKDQHGKLSKFGRHRNDSRQLLRRRLKKRDAGKSG